MKTTNITRATALTMALALICGSAASCKSTTKSEAKTATELLSNSYKAEPVETDIEFGYVQDMVYSPESGKVYLAASKKDNENPGIFVTDLSFKDFTETETANGDEKDFSLRMAAADDGSLYVLKSVNDYGDMEFPDTDAPDFDYSSYDFEALEAARVTTYYFMHLGSDGNIIDEHEIKGVDKYVDSSAYPDSFGVFGRDKFIITFSGQETKAIAIDADGNIEDNVDISGFDWVMGSSETSDGKNIICGYTPKGIRLKYMDTDSLKPDGNEIETDNNLNTGIMSVFKGSGDYLIYADTETSLYGVKSDGTFDEVINWTDSDVGNDYGRAVIPLENGEFIIFNSEDKSFSRMTKRDSSEFENTRVLTLAMTFDDGTISQKVKDFNKSHDGIRIKAVDYQKFNQFDEGSTEMKDSAESHLKMDIISGNAPDMVITYGNSLQLSLANKGVFTDMGEWLDSDSGLSREDIMPNVLEASKINGKLLSLPSNFTIDTMAVKKKFCDKENWTFEDLKETYSKMPEDMELTELTTRSSAFYLVRNVLGNCIDYEKGTCNFDSDKFREILEFCSQFKDEQEVMDWYQSASDDELQSYFNESQTRYKEEKTLLYEMYLGDFSDYTIAKQAMFNDDITLVGLPTTDGKGSKLTFTKTCSILESSSSKQECWEFVKSFFEEENGIENRGYGFPSLISAFEKLADKATKPNTYTDEDGEEHEIDNSYYINGKEIKIEPLTAKERDYLVDYIKNTDSAGLVFTEETEKIITDCINAYFKKEKSVDETIELINSKISILLSEQS